ncbi:MFS transporter [Williamsia serinedens]|uniref:Arabinose efflux permease, MFS family n=1 Tax=Williamsia serinedens TaxID=391736 RepID=A0ABT1GWS4_9NOCA|nr:MFS transporter [Williamsia serinedens]MCP2158845.1 putative arabinose efflux permease, MFS family [Williamsia serinedens]
MTVPAGGRSEAGAAASPSIPWASRRRAVSTVFFVNGLLAAMWVAHIPVISDATGVDHGTLGALLLLLGGCAFLGMQVCGPIIDRHGSRAVILVAAATLAVAALLPVLASTTWQLALALALFGLANGSIDVGMNAHAVVVEQDRGRPVMSSFHGFFSLGGLVGSGIVAVGLFLGVPVVLTVAVVAVGSVVGVAVIRPSLTRGRHRTDDAGRDHEAGSRFPAGIRGRIVLMAAVAFALMLAEGTAYDWSALHTTERFGVGDGVGALAFGAFSATMLVGRFLADRVTARFGAVAVVRGGAATAALGMAVVIAAPAPAVGILGWAVFGIGVAGGVPQLFTAAGNVTAQPSGRVISTVVGCGYLGMLAGPAVVGFVSRATTLGTALWVAVAAMAFGCVAAGVVRAGGGRGARRRGDTPAVRARLDA